MTTVLSENFDGPNSGWETINDIAYLSKMVDGDYFIRNRHNENWYITDKLAKFNPDSNFIIEALIKKEGGINHDGFGISWGRKNGHNAYSFTIASNGNFEIGKWDGNKWVYLTRQETDLINRGKRENKLKIHKKNDEYRFFINDSLVDIKKYEPLKGTKVGFIIYNRISIAVKTLKVKGTPSVKHMSDISSARRTNVPAQDTSMLEEAIDTITTVEQVPVVAAASETPKEILPQAKVTQTPKRKIKIESDGRLIVSSIEIDDVSANDRASYNVGNGNAKLEKGEAVTVKLELINNGALITNDKIVVEAAGKGFMLVHPTNTFKVLKLDQSDVVKIEFDIFVARKYQGSTAPLSLRLEGSTKGVISINIPVY